MRSPNKLAPLGVPLSATRYRQFMLIVLLVIFAFNFVDRLVIGLVLQDIKTDLHLTDTQLGLLTGTAFAIFYSIMGLPIARWADRGNRVTLIAVTTLLWSAAVVLCGLVQSFWHLLSIRIGVAVGEAGCMPPAHSLIADHFNRAERPRAVSTYMLGAPLSAVIGYFLAGWLNELYGWRMTFVILGLPGIVLAAIAWITLREPRCSRESATLIRSSRSAPKLGLVAATLWRNVTFRHLLLCFAVTYFFGSGILQWQPAFFIRSFGLRTGELGTWFALIYGLGGLLGTYLGGVLASRYAANDERLQLKAMAAAYAGFGVVSAAIYTSQDVHFAFAMTALSAIGGTVAMGPMFAMIQSLVPPDMRAVSIAALYFLANLVGMGLGPLAAGGLSDVLRAIAGEESLRYALLALCPGYLWAAWHLWRGSRSVTRDIDAARTHELANTIESEHVSINPAGAV